MHTPEHKHRKASQQQVDDITILDLPYPPTINHYWGVMPNGQKYIKKHGRKYRENMQLLMQLKHLTLQLQGRLHVFVDVYPPDNMRRDLDNILKALLDALEHSNVFVNDNQIDKLVVERMPKRPPFGMINVRLIEFSNMQPNFNVKNNAI